MIKGLVKFMGILTDFTFQIVLVGTVILAMASGVVGTVTVLRGQSLIGDAIGHSTFAGIVIAFMLFQSKNTLVLTLGALIAGMVAFYFIELIHKHSLVSLNSALALVLSSFFGLGMALKSYIQGNPQLAEASQAGLQNYIFGQAAFLLKSDVWLIILASVIALSIFIACYQQIKIFVFDPNYAKSVGIRANVLNWLILLMAIVMIVVGLKAVGAILISNMLITPAITGLQWSKRFPIVLLVAAVSGGISAGIGTYLSSTITNLPTGPTIIVVMSIVSLLSIIFGPRGYVMAYLRRKRYLASHQEDSLHAEEVA
ncbi:metal ABC transporter permease [Aerococcaceae bacterium 50-4]